jgi:hypothetical protein
VTWVNQTDDHKRVYCAQHVYGTCTYMMFQILTCCLFIRRVKCTPHSRFHSIIPLSKPSSTHHVKDPGEEHVKSLFSYFSGQQIFSLETTPRRQEKPTLKFVISFTLPNSVCAVRK